MAAIYSRFFDPQFLTEYAEYLLLIIFLFSFLEVVVPPIPGDTVLIIGSSLGGMVGIHPLWIILSASTGTYSASLLLYFFGSKLEEKILESPRFSWWLDTKTFFRIQIWFQKYGYWILLLSRFLPIARSGIVVAAGMVKFGRRRSLTALAISVLWSSTVFVLFGRIIGTRWRELTDLWQQWRGYGWFVLGIAILMGIIIRVKKTQTTIK